MRALFKKPGTIFILLTIAFLLRLQHLGREFSGDEGILAFISGLHFCQIIPTLVFTEVYPPLTHAMLHLWITFNNSIIWTRLFFVFFGVGTCGLIYLLCKEFLNEKFARINLLFSVFSPLLIFTSQYVRSYADSTFWMVLSILFFLKIIKGKDMLVNWIGYVVSITLSMYSFYFSALFIVSQLIFVLIFKWRDKRVIFKFLIAYLCLVLLFLPWVFFALTQFEKGTGINLNWSDKGFNFGPFRLGLYARTLFSLFGFDPSFLVFPEGILQNFQKNILLLMVVITFIGFYFLLKQSFKFLSERFPNDRSLAVFPLFLSFIPLLLSWISAGLLNTLPTAKHILILHVIFLMVISAFVLGLLEKRRWMGVSLMILIILIFLARIPEAVSVEIEVQKAVSFLEKNVVQQDCILSMRSGFPPGAAQPVVAGQYFKMNENRSRYISASDQAQKNLELKLSRFDKIWFLRVYSNDEVFGANSMLLEWLKKIGYKQVRSRRFKNIDVVLLQK